MDVQSLKNMLQGEMTGKAIGLVASYCIKHKKSDAIKKFQEFGESIAPLFTEQERQELQRELDNLMQQQAEAYADVFEKTYSPDQEDGR